MGFHADLRHVMFEMQSLENDREDQSVEISVPHSAPCCAPCWPPTLPETDADAVTAKAAHVYSSGPRAVPAWAVDVDAALRSLGLDVDEPQVSDAMAPDLPTLRSCLDRGELPGTC